MDLGREEERVRCMERVTCKVTLPYVKYGQATGICCMSQKTKTGTLYQPRCPSTEEWIKKWWYIYTMQYYSAIKRNAFESVLVRWVNIEPIIQSEVSQKEKDKYRILMHIYRIQKNCTEEFTYRAAVEKKRQKIDIWIWGEGRRG